ncbi:MAG: enoyl-CoA hydratase/isomerase family protein, partial [Myxococcales bacterium]|nr:enoyl-CoA hydratase/isomerase family protein [Myxococcales bacterium]
MMTTTKKKTKASKKTRTSPGAKTKKGSTASKKTGANKNHKRPKATKGSQGKTASKRTDDPNRATVTQGQTTPGEPLSIEKRESGLAILWMDIPGEAVNTLKESFAEDFTRAFQNLGEDRDVKAVVLASRKRDSFIAGADIQMIKGAASVEEAESLSRNGQTAMHRIESFKKPVEAAIPGPCL